MVEAVVTTTQAAALLGASRQHVADLADREEIHSWRNGTHRRFRREDVLAYLTRLRGATDVDDLGAMTLTDRRSLAYGLMALPTPTSIGGGNSLLDPSTRF